MFGRIAAPLVAVVIRRGLKADLDRLKRILESDSQATGDERSSQCTLMPFCGRHRCASLPRGGMDEPSLVAAGLFALAGADRSRIAGWIEVDRERALAPRHGIYADRIGCGRRRFE